MKKHKTPNLHGEANPRSKLTNAQVKKIAKELSTGGIASRLLAEKYGVKETTIDCIRTGSTWSSVTGGNVRPEKLLTKAGELHSRVILTDRKVKKIRAACIEGASIVALAAHYGVHYTTIYDIRERRSWKHLE